MKAMCPPGYHHNDFVATDGLGHMMYGYTLLVPMNQRVLNKLSNKQTYIMLPMTTSSLISDVIFERAILIITDSLNFPEDNYTSHHK